LFADSKNGFLPAKIAEQRSPITVVPRTRLMKRYKWSEYIDYLIFVEASSVDRTGSTRQNRKSGILGIVIVVRIQKNIIFLLSLFHSDFHKQLITFLINIGYFIKAVEVNKTNGKG
jgi:hypothetical protein